MVGRAAQAGVAAAALAAVELGCVRGKPRQQVSVDPIHAPPSSSAGGRVTQKIVAIYDYGLDIVISGGGRFVSLRLILGRSYTTLKKDIYNMMSSTKRWLCAMRFLRHS